MNDSPNCVGEKRRTECGMPLSPISIGIVTCFSTSSAARPENSVMTWTCVSVTSGNASTGRDLKAATPPAMNSTTSRIKKNGWSSAKDTTRLIIVLLCRQHIAEQQDAARYNTVTAGKTFLNNRVALGVPDRFDFTFVDPPHRVFCEHKRFSSACQYCCGRNSGYPSFRSPHDTDARKHFRLQ